MFGETSTTSTVIRWLSSAITTLVVGEDPADRVDELERPEGLREVLRRAGGHADRAVAVALVRRQHDDGDLLRRRVGLQHLADLEPVRARAHVDVEQDEVRDRKSTRLNSSHSQI